MANSSTKPPTAPYYNLSQTGYAHRFGATSGGYNCLDAGGLAAAAAAGYAMSGGGSSVATTSHGDDASNAAMLSAYVGAQNAAFYGHHNFYSMMGQAATAAHPHQQYFGAAYPFIRMGQFGKHKCYNEFFGL